jgi:hypothetical protein
MKASLKRNLFLLGLSTFVVLPWAASQTVESASTIAAASSPAAVPPLIPYSGAALDVQGRTLPSPASITFLIFKEQTGGEPLFAETQTVVLDPTGHYKANLGATLPNGLPADLFSTGEARWLEVQVAGQPAQSRVLLASVPYALKAGDAATLGGLPASAYALAGSAKAATAATALNGIQPNTVSNVTTTGGTAGFIPEFSGTTTIIDSPVFVLGSDIGIGTTTPTATLDVKGTALVSGLLSANGGASIGGALTLPATGTATTAGGFDSQLLKLYTSGYNSSTHAAVNPRFEWQAVHAGNNTASPSATLDLLSSATSAAATQTGFSFNINGTMNFAPGQTFPGAGTITGVKAGTALTGGGSTGTVTLNVDTTKVPLLASANSFTGNQSVTGNVSATGALSANGDINLPATASAAVGVLNIGGVPFLHGYAAGKEDTFVGGAGNFSSTGSVNTGTGFSSLASVSSAVKNSADGAFALKSTTTGSKNAAAGVYSLTNNTIGNYNSAEGYSALFLNTTGSGNTAVGASALYQNTTGSDNTGIGSLAGPDSASAGLSNATAIGAHAAVSQSNSLVLGQTTAGSPGSAFVNVGIGTATPISTLEAAVLAPEALGPTLTLTNPVRNGDWGFSSIDFNTYAPSSYRPYNPSSRIEAIGDVGSGDTLVFQTNSETGSMIGPNNGLHANMVIGSNGRVSIGGGDTNIDNYLAQLVVSSDQVQTYDEIAAIFALGNAPSQVPSANGLIGIDAIGGDGVGTAQGDSGGDGGVFSGGYAAENSSAPGGYGIYASGGFVTGAAGTEAYAGYFDGDINVTGAVHAGTKDFKIDHPLDPANKYLYHASVESSEMMDIYSGNVVTDELGLATVKLPDWFEAENTDFRYQLTVLDERFAQAVVSKKIQNNQFTIHTNASHVEVSWQITAVRQDAYAKAHPLVVEQQKPANERGFYIHPELFGQPGEKQTEWGRRPQQMQRMKELREQQARRAAQHAKTLRHDQPASAVGRTFPVAEAPALNPIETRQP